MPADTLIRFHLSLNVNDLGKSVAFYRALFGREPAKLRADYAKFEPDQPPLVLSLEPTPRAVGGPLNHVGIRLPDSKALVALQARLEAAGLHSQREEGVECCYAKQTKFWLHDPDGTLWEIYTLDDDIDHRGDGQREEVVRANAPAVTRRVEWEHRMGQPVPERIPLEDQTADEVRLRGTMNLTLPDDQRKAIVAEALRVLKPGGRVFVHVLTGDQTVASPELPGPASAVRHVPSESEPVELLEKAGFTAIRFLKFDTKPCFIRNGVEMRETQIEAWKPSTVPANEGLCEVVYRGPSESMIEGGQTFRRGVRVTMPRNQAEQFRTPQRSAQFTIIDKPDQRVISLNACGA